MLKEIIQLDHQLFYAINTGLSNSFFDVLMPILRNKYTWIPFYVFLIVFFLRQYKLNGIFLILALAATFGFADFSSATLIKKTVKRLRPCNEPTFVQEVKMRIDCGSGYSFPSTHATDHFAIAVFLIGIFYKKYKFVVPVLLTWAFLIAFAQVYVGVHFPIDVICGSIYGAIIGWAFAKLFNFKFSIFNKV
jgi:membrane-associated phospholipid phosphatase